MRSTDTIRVLVIEEDQEDLTLIRQCLETGLHEMAVSIVHVIDFPQALGHLEKSTFDICLSEYRLRGVDGPYFIHDLRTRKIQIPIIFIAGQGDQETAVKAMKAGAADFLIKHKLTSELLGSAVRYAIMLRREELLYQKEKQAKQESEDRYRAVVEQSAEGIFLFDADTKRVIESNAALRRLLGYTAEELLNLTIYDLVAHDRSDIDSRIESFVKEKKHYMSERQYKRKDGTLVDVEASANVITYGGKDVLCTVVRDITQRKKVEAELAHERDLLHSLMDSTPDCIFFKDLEGRFTRVNNSLINMFGDESAENIIGSTDFDRMPAEYAQEFRDDELKIMQTKQPTISKEEIGFLKDGTPNWFSTTKSPICDKKGNVTGLVGIARNVTERRLAEELRKKEQEFFKTMLESIDEGILASDEKGNLTLYNRAAGEFLGLPEKLIPFDQWKNYCQIFLADNMTPIDAKEFPLTAMVKGKKVPSQELMIIPKKGQPHIVLFSGSLIRGDKGKALGAVAVMYDITERKRFEGALAAEKERLGVTLRSIAEGVIATDSNGKVALMNQVAEELTGWKEAQSLGRPIQEVLIIVQEKSRQPFPDPLKEILGSSKRHVSESSAVLLPATGGEYPISFSASPMLSGEGKVVGAVLVFRDLTERLKMENEILKVQKLESVGVLAGGIAHDFNNLLTTIIGNLSLCKHHLGEAEIDVPEILTEAEKAALRAKNLAQQLLTFSKGGVPIRKTASVAELLIESARFATRGSRAKCEFQIPQDLWPADFDGGQMNQVIHNLVLNAVQAMEEGGEIQVRASNMTLSDSRKSELPLPAGKYVRIEVQDMGSGIPKENLSRIFDPYFTTRKNGTGLGLTTCYSIVKKHDGYITVDSEAGRGSTFSIYLPASSGDQFQSKVKPTSVMRGRGRVLVMDDEESIRNLVSRMLQHLGYQVEVTPGVEEALKSYRKAMGSQQPFDLVIADLTIPGGMGGRELIQELKKISPDVKTIVSSGYSTDPILANYRQYGFQAVVTKPYELSELSQILQTVLAPSMAEK